MQAGPRLFQALSHKKETEQAAPLNRSWYIRKFKIFKTDLFLYEKDNSLFFTPRGRLHLHASFFLVWARTTYPARSRQHDTALRLMMFPSSRATWAL